jgi:hypothetical protein
LATKNLLKFVLNKECVQNIGNRHLNVIHAPNVICTWYSAGLPNVVLPKVILPNVVSPNIVLPNVVLPTFVLPRSFLPNDDFA